MIGAPAVPVAQRPTATASLHGVVADQDRDCHLRNQAAIIYEIGVVDGQSAPVIVHEMRTAENS